VVRVGRKTLRSNGLSAKLALATALLSVLTGVRPGSAAPLSTFASIPAETIAYISGWHVELQALGDSQPRTLPAPWPVSGVGWSPTGRQLVIEDWYHRLAVLDLITNRTYIVVQNPVSISPYDFGLGATPATYEWSPDGKYLTFYRPDGKSSLDVLLWNDVTHTSRVLVRGVPNEGAAVSWSSDSTSLAVSVGPSDFGAVSRHPVSRQIRVLNLASGSSRLLTYGFGPQFSPDGRFVSFARIAECGAVECSGNEFVIAAGGGPATTLGVYDTPGMFPRWARTSQGYGFDRWLIGPKGHLAGTIAQTSEKVDAWAPSGNLAAVQSLTQYTARPISLTVVSASGRRTWLFSTATPQPCGSCTRVYYQVAWVPDSAGLAFVSPNIFTAQNATVSGHLYIVRDLSSPTPVQVQLPSSGSLGLFGIDRGNHLLLVGAGSRLWRVGLSTGTATSISPPVDKSYFYGFLPNVALSPQFGVVSPASTYGY
jgi:WD40-like Beta Propeller Repeat